MLARRPLHKCGQHVYNLGRGGHRGDFVGYLASGCPEGRFPKEAQDCGGDGLARGHVRTERYRGAAVDASSCVAELVGGLGQAQLWQAGSESAEERPGPGVRGDDLAVLEDLGLGYPALDGDVWRLRPKDVWIAIRTSASCSRSA